jgi:site-specific DNA-methyltransferase (adenine-specific)
MYDNHGTGKMYSIGTDMKSKVDPLAHIPKNSDGMLTGFYENGESNETGSSYINKPKGAGNNHPTVKPVALMKYLIKLVTPQGGKVLDPFTGSGSTGMAAVELDYDFTGCELDQDYVDIANNRITAWKNKTDLENNPLPEEWFEEE